MQIPNKSPGDSFTSSECDQIVGELENIITQAGIQLSNADTSQVLAALQMLAPSSAMCTASGSPDVIALTPKTGVQIKKYLDGMQFNFFAVNTNTGAVNINVSNLGNVELKDTSKAPLQAGSILAGQYYSVLYDGTEFILISLVYNIPVGSRIGFVGVDLPPGWLWMRGEEVKRTDYPALWAHAQRIEAVTGEWGGFTEGDGISTFGLPDAQGLTTRNLDTKGSTDPGRKLGTTQTDGMPELTGWIDNLTPTEGTKIIAVDGKLFKTSIPKPGQTGQGGGITRDTRVDFSNKGITGVNIAPEVRMKNFAENWIIKY